MRLLITTPSKVLVDDTDVISVRAEDQSGSFGILNGHADFLTALTVSVVSWRPIKGAELFCVVRRGVLSVSNGNLVAIATREALVGDDLDRLEQEVMTEFRNQVETERIARSGSLQLQLRAMRQIVQYLRPGQVGRFGDSL